MVQGDQQNKRAISGGVYVILITGFLGALGFGQGSKGFADYAIVGAIVVATMVGAFLLHRFIKKHGSEIGEARFTTTDSTDTTPNRSGG